jgi:hypothetical protein
MPYAASPSASPYKQASTNFGRIIESVVTQAGRAGVDFRPFAFHHLRHRHAVDWLKSGRSIYVLQKRMGHTSIKTTLTKNEFGGGGVRSPRSLGNQGSLGGQSCKIFLAFKFPIVSGARPHPAGFLLCDAHAFLLAGRMTITLTLSMRLESFDIY